jgi:putative intracellular protease/amidase
MFGHVTVRTLVKASLIVLVLLAVGALGFGGWIFSLPSAAKAEPASATPPEEHAATVAALKPPKRQRPVIAVVGINDGTETTDYLMPTGILRRADVAEVLLVATGAGPVELYPALKVDADLTIQEFDARYPEGADYVLVPAMRRADDAVVLDWLRKQSGAGAIVIGVCVGATVVANAGLLDGRRGTTHWYYLEGMLESHPSIQYVRDRRYVVDRGVASTTGITASMPITLTLIEAIAGRPKALDVARALGSSDWDARHRSDAFGFTREFALAVSVNKLSFWGHETFSIELKPGMDEVTLALLADAWSRTYRSRAVTFATLPDAVTSRNGVRIHPERAISGAVPGPVLAVVHSHMPARALQETLWDIRNRYGSRTESVVATQLEYPATF